VSSATCFEDFFCTFVVSGTGEVSKVVISGRGEGAAGAGSAGNVPNGEGVEGECVRARDCDRCTIEFFATMGDVVGLFLFGGAGATAEGTEVDLTGAVESSLLGVNLILSLSFSPCLL
jgi:hypothetical protein